MPLARVVTFEDVDPDHLRRQAAEMESGDRPDEIPASEMLVLHDGSANRAVVVLFFESEEDYATADAALDAMDAGETPGRRTSVGRYSVVARRTA